MSRQIWSELHLMRSVVATMTSSSKPFETTSCVEMPTHHSILQPHFFAAWNSDKTSETSVEYKARVAELSADHPESKQISRRIYYIIHSLTKLTVDEMRKGCFAESDRLRSLGESTQKNSIGLANPFKRFDVMGSTSAGLVGTFMQRSSLEHERVSSLLCDLYVAYLRRQPAIIESLLAIPEKDAQSPPQTPPDTLSDDRRHQCLFGCGAFRSRGNLTKHNTNVHFKKGTFDKPFPCPACLPSATEPVPVINRPIQRRALRKVHLERPPVPISARTHNADIRIPGSSILRSAPTASR